VNYRFSALTDESESLAGRAADASRGTFVPRPRATRAGLLPLVIGRPSGPRGGGAIAMAPLEPRPPLASYLCGWSSQWL
jgi:hypothetical protein